MYNRIETDLGPSPGLACALFLLWVPLTVLLWVLPIHASMATAGSAVTLFIAARQARQLGLLAAPDSPRGYRIQSGRFILKTANGMICEGYLCPTSRIWPHLAVLRIIPAEGGRPRHLVLSDFPYLANTPSETLRRTYVLLRHDPPTQSNEKGDVHG